MARSKNSVDNLASVDTIHLAQISVRGGASSIEQPGKPLIPVLPEWLVITKHADVTVTKTLAEFAGFVGQGLRPRKHINHASMHSFRKHGREIAHPGSSSLQWY
jgi:hypothetical protein